MARRQKDIFAKENKYEGNIFKKFGRWFGKLKNWQKGLFIGIAIILIVAIGLGSYIFAKLNMMDRVT